jgi:hypothetical protein
VENNGGPVVENDPFGNQQFFGNLHFCGVKLGSIKKLGSPRIEMTRYLERLFYGFGKFGLNLRTSQDLPSGKLT